MTMANVNGIRTNPFKNPDRKPLEKLELMVQKDGHCRKVAALSIEWTEKRQFMRYEAPCIYDQKGDEIMGAKDRWLELVTYITKDFEWLLHLPFYKFWSNILHDHSIVESLVAFLQESPTFYNLERFPNYSAMRDLYERLAHVVLIVFGRLVISKASKEEFISCEKHGSFLYDEFLFTVPMILDICQLYGRENRKVVETIISTVIKLQPEYKDDLKATVEFLIEIFKNVERRFDDRTIPSSTGAVPLSSLVSAGQNITLENLEDVVVHLLDVSSNISVFLDVYPPASDLFCTDELINEIIHIYGDTIPKMYKRLDTLAFKDETVVKYTELKHFLDVTRIELLKIFRTLIYHNISMILEQPNPSEVPEASEHVDQFINFLDKAVTEKEFMLDYHASYPVEIDLELVTGICHDVDPVKFNFIKRSVYAEFVEPNKRMNSDLRSTNNATTSAVAGTSGLTQQTAPVGTNERQNAQAKSHTTPNPIIELDSLITNVKDIFGDLGEGFIEMCLKHYNYDPSLVVNAVLEHSLPEHLNSIDKQLPYIPPDPMASSAAVDQALGAERLCVFDNDEFDVMTRDSIDTTRVHKGKRKDIYKNMGQLLDDKSHIKDVGHIYEKFSIIQDDYEDEYDDTYDSHSVGLRGVDEPVEMDGKMFTTPRVLRSYEKREPGAEEEDEEDSAEVNEGSSKFQRTRENFIQDPAELRARAEQRRMSKYGAGGSGGTRGNGGTWPQVDLVGKPKGKGNSKSVLNNRDKKNTHKASRANHNRASGAEHKRRQGMVPS